METRHDLGAAVKHWDGVVSTIARTVELHLLEISYLRKRVDALEFALKDSIEWAKDIGGDLSNKSIEKWTEALNPKAVVTPEDFNINENEQREG